jgi:CBS domain-containing protein
MSLQVSAIIARKGAEVRTTAPDATVADAVAQLAEHRIGALVVSADGSAVAGIISERDIVAALAADGPGVLGQPVRRIMTAPVTTCAPTTTCDELMSTMTRGRIRHLPVVEDDALAGMVSIGDVVKARLDELEVQTEAMERYVTGSV